MIYITTHHHVMNFGAELQAYALQNTLDSMGYDSRFIWLKGGPKPRSRTGLAGKAYDCMRVVCRRMNKKEIKAAEENFNAFCKTYHRTAAQYESFTALKEKPPKANVYISGSDQVFNPVHLNPEFFLQFGEKKVKRISYAGSVAVNDVPPEKKEKFREYLSCFDRLSIRESASEGLIKEYYDKPVAVHVDPSFLVEKSHWEKLCSQSMRKRLKKPYILVYTLYRPVWLNEYLKRLKKELGYEIVTLQFDTYRNLYSTKTVRSAGPREFLELVKNAEMVLSSSYHGCVFSAIFRKPFYAIVNPNSPARIQSMLKLFRLEDRILTPETKVDFDMDYNFFEETLPKETEKAKKYLKEAIEG